MPAKIVQKNRKPFRKLKVDSVTARLNLRNRSHAVAYAVRQGLI